MYFDTAYIAKFYLNEPDSAAVRAIIKKAPTLRCSAWALVELQCVFHRNMREGHITEAHANELATVFSEHVTMGLWRLIPVTEALLRRTGALVAAAPATVFLRSGDALHLVSALEAGEHEVWSNDRHLLAAAPHFGLAGRTVPLERTEPALVG